MLREGLSASDVALLNGNHNCNNGGGFGFGAGGGWLGGILLGALLGRGFFGGFNGLNGGGEVVVPRSEISNDTVYTQLSGQMNSLGNNISDRFTDIGAGINGLGRDVLQSNFNTAVGQASLSKEIGNVNFVNAMGQKDIEKEICKTSGATMSAISNATLQSLMSDNQINSNLDSCCCSIKGEIKDLRSDIIQQLCNLGYKIDLGNKDILTQQFKDTQTIMGAIANLRIETKDNRISQLENQVNTLQTAGIVDNAVLKAMQNFGRCCGNNNGC